jgi:integrase
LATERVIIGHWNEHLGHVRLDHITRAVINKYIEHRQAAGRSGRTVNLEVTVLRNVLNKAIDDGWLASLPTQNLRPLKWTPKKRELITKADIDTLCKVALEEDEAGQPKFKNGRQFADYVQLMAFCGSRRDETLRLKWTDVDWERRQLTIGADGQSKNRKHGVVDFNANLHAHLKAMHQRRAPDSDWLFPSPQRGERDAPAKTFVETLRLVREEANLPSFRFHDLRHFFISFCVMSGIDYMTIARWVGHQDGGVLIGKVYGHLSNEHAQQQARRVHFELVSVVSEPAA